MACKHRDSHVDSLPSIGTFMTMAPKVKKNSFKSEELYAGGPKELPQSDLPTNSDIACYT
jgi:hypothetical protein